MRAPAPSGVRPARRLGWRGRRSRRRPRRSTRSTRRGKSSATPTLTRRDPRRLGRRLHPRAPRALSRPGHQALCASVIREMLSADSVSRTSRRLPSLRRLATRDPGRCGAAASGSSRSGTVRPRFARDVDRFLGRRRGGRRQGRMDLRTVDGTAMSTALSKLDQLRRRRGGRTPRHGARPRTGFADRPVRRLRFGLRRRSAGRGLGDASAELGEPVTIGWPPTMYALNRNAWPHRTDCPGRPAARRGQTLRLDAYVKRRQDADGDRLAGPACASPRPSAA